MLPAAAMLHLLCRPGKECYNDVALHSSSGQLNQH
jgi:hypothetical protein